MPTLMSETPQPGAIVPRYRYDQLMRLGWKVFLPTSLVAVAVVAGWQVYTGFGS